MLNLPYRLQCVPILDIRVREIAIDKNDVLKQAKKAEKIAFSLQNCLDFKEGGEVAENLNYLYRHIRFATKIYLEKDKKDLMESALFVSSEILEGWKGISSKVA